MRKQTNEIVANTLKTQGWLVFDLKDDSANGCDLTIAKNGRTFRIEVKSVICSKKGRTIKPVQKSGLKCDAIAILMPNGHVVLQPMDEHLALCSKLGTRSLTTLVRLVGE